MLVKGATGAYQTNKLILALQNLVCKYNHNMDIESQISSYYKATEEN